jgi:DNA replicative helicase MCM subunit Mcm2 (Cdc46/Mcm family)
MRLGKSEAEIWKRFTDANPYEYHALIHDVQIRPAMDAGKKEDQQYIKNWHHLGYPRIDFIGQNRKGKTTIIEVTSTATFAQLAKLHAYRRLSHLANNGDADVAAAIVCESISEINRKIANELDITIHKTRS